MTCEVTSTVLVTIVARSVFGPDWPVVLLTIAAMVVVSYVFVGVGPRTLGRQHPYRVALLLAVPVRALGRVFGPLASLLILFGNAVTPGRGFRDGPFSFSSEAELRELVDMAERGGVVEHDEREMIQSVFDLGDTIAREVMVPRTEIVWIEHTKTVPQAMALALRSGFSRIPVIGENVDDIIGVVYLKDLARRSQDSERARTTTVDEVMRQPILVPESKPVNELMREMQLHRTHITIIIDEYGGTAGLVTIEDILEEIVGEITDEYDNESPPIERLDENTARVTARLSSRIWRTCSIWICPTGMTSRQSPGCSPSASVAFRSLERPPGSTGWSWWPRAPAADGTGSTPSSCGVCRRTTYTPSRKPRWRARDRGVRRGRQARHPGPGGPSSGW